MEYKKIERLSPSSIIKFLADYKGWYKNYILGEKEPDNIYFQFGTAFHGLLEDFFLSSPKAGETLKEYTTYKYDELFKKWFENNTELKDFIQNTEIMTMQDCSDWTYAYLKQWLLETEITEKKYGTEKAFGYNSPTICEWHLEDKELKIHGYADAYFGKDKFNPASGFLNFHTVEDAFSLLNENKEHLITDYKTSKMDRCTNNTKYYLQCMIYAVMFKRANKRKSMNFIAVDYLKFRMKHFYVVTESNLSSIEKLIKDVWLLVDKINENPEKYFDAPPSKLSLGDYIKN